MNSLQVFGKLNAAPSTGNIKKKLSEFFDCIIERKPKWRIIQFEEAANLGGEKEKKVKERKIIPKGVLGFLAIAILAIGLVAVTSATQTIESKEVTAGVAIVAALGIVIAMVISVAVRLAKTCKVGPPSGFAVNSVNAVIVLAMIAVNARYLYTAKSSISVSPQKLIKNNGCSRKL